LLKVTPRIKQVAVRVLAVDLTRLAGLLVVGTLHYTALGLKIYILYWAHPACGRTGLYVEPEVPCIFCPPAQNGQKDIASIPCAWLFDTLVTKPEVPLVKFPALK
jgi:hypothetical protein